MQPAREGSAGWRPRAAGADATAGRSLGSRTIAGGGRIGDRVRERPASAAPWREDPFTQSVLAATRTIRRREKIRQGAIRGLVATAAIAASVGLGFFLVPPPAGPALRPHGTSAGYEPATRTSTSFRKAVQELAKVLPDGMSPSLLLRMVRQDPQAALAMVLSIQDPDHRRAIPAVAAATMVHTPSRLACLPFLRACLDAGDPGVVRSAMRGLEITCKASPQGCDDVLHNLLDHPDAGVRALAARLREGS